MNSTASKTGMVMRNGEKIRAKKRFIDYAVPIDFLLNIAISIFFFIRMRSVLQMGFDAAMESDFGIATGSEALDTMLIFATPIMGFIISLSLITELIYLIIKLRGKQPFITEKYAVVFIISKIICLIFLIGCVLLF